MANDQRKDDRIGDKQNQQNEEPVELRDQDLEDTSGAGGRGSTTSGPLGGR